MRTDLLYNKMNQKKKNSATLNFKRVEKKRLIQDGPKLT